MDAVAVSEVLVVTAGEVKRVRLTEAGRVAVRGGEDDQYGIAGGDVLSADREGFGGETPGGQLYRAVVAEQLLDTGVEQLPLAALDRLLKSCALLRVSQERVHAVTDQVDRGLETGEEKHKTHRGGLVLREVLAVVGGSDEV